MYEHASLMDSLNLVISQKLEIGKMDSLNQSSLKLGKVENLDLKESQMVSVDGGVIQVPVSSCSLKM